MKRSMIVTAAACAAATAGFFASTAQAAPAPGSSTDPTAGLTQYTDTYKVQHPYNLPESARFSITNGVYNLFILKGDKGYSPGTPTGARTEMRWGSNWSSGEHLWSSDVEIDPGTTGTCIMQVHVNGQGEAIYIQTKNGNLYNSVGTLLATNIVGSWFHLDAAYNPSTHLVQIWVNNRLALSAHYTKPAGTGFYFKNGVYNLSGAKSETHFKNIELWH
uniref:polysaccharide lyase family 7 protein n=1 Tax=Catenulispora sp. GAS73 TaxID=3156269 RepID=UPI0035181AE3